MSYSSAEQRFQHRKTLFFDNRVNAGKVMPTFKLIEALHFSSKVFDSTKWKTKWHSIIKDMLQSKLSQHKELNNHILKNMNFDLSEAGRNEYHAVGFKLIDKKTTNKTSWKGQNKLGQILYIILYKFMQSFKNS